MSEMGMRQNNSSEDRRGELLCMKSWPCRAQLCVAGSTMPATAKQITIERHHEAESRDAHLRLIQGGR